MSDSSFDEILLDDMEDERETLSLSKFSLSTNSRELVKLQLSSLDVEFCSLTFARSCG